MIYPAMNTCDPIRLWNQTAPFATPEDATRVERFLPSDDGIERLTDVATPTLTFYPASGRGPHPAVLICPGGGYGILAWNHEGKDVAGWLNAHGISAFLLKYRNREGWKTDPDLCLSANTPPTFLVQTQDDTLVDSSLAYYIALKAAGVPSELHIFPSGGHGYGLLRKGRPSDAWAALAIDWFSGEVVRSRAW